MEIFDNKINKIGYRLREICTQQMECTLFADTNI